MSKAPITTHILLLDTGRPAAGVPVSLYRPGEAEPLAQALSDSDGRVLDWGQKLELVPGIYRLEFAVGAWYAAQGRACFYPEVSLSFNVDKNDEHYHVPLLLNAYGYSTYRGS